MTTATTDDQHLAQLKNLLQEKKKEHDFEKMTAALMAELLGLPIFVASSGFQHGADAGTGGQATRRLRLECKKYSDTTDLDVRELIGEIEQASTRDLLSFHPRDLTNRGWIWFKEQLETADRDLRGILYRILALADESRFGRQLLDQHWTWDPKETVWTNHFGSLALIAGGRSVPFDQLAPRIVPWLVLEAARVRGADEFEVRLAADIVGAVIENGKMAEPDPGSDLVFRRDEKTPAPFHIEIELRPNAVVTANPAQKLRDMLDRDARAEEWNRAIKAAHERIDEARANGASFYMTDLDAVFG